MKVNIFFFCTYFHVKLIYIFIFLSLSQNNTLNISNHQNEIHLIIKWQGNIQFINNSFYTKPSEIFVNGLPIDSNQNAYNFNEVLNNVTLKFNDSINSFKSIFNGLINITEIDLSNFDTSQVTDMQYMFYMCKNLEKINFGNINTSLVTNMSHLFSNCSSLTSIDLSKFNTKNLVYMRDIFSYCYKLISVDLSNFDTSKVVNMRGLFYQCDNLRYIDLTNFNTSLVNNFIGMFGHCKSLVYINLRSFIIKEGADIDVVNFLLNTHQNIKICIEDENSFSLLKKQKNESNFNCSDICFQENIKIDLKQNRCVDYCYNYEFKYEYNNFCYEICPNATYLSNNNNYSCLDKKINGIYYYDNNFHLYKECFNTCKICNEEGNEKNNNCIECKSGFIFLNDSIYNNNCYKNCEYFYYFDDLNNHKCTKDYICPEKYNKLINNKKKCIDDCSKDNIFKYNYNNICYEKCPNGTRESNYICFDYETTEEDKNIKILQEFITNNKTIENIIKNKQDFVQQKDNITYQITTSENQKNKTNNNISTINLESCENKLRDIYKINETLPLIIFKIDYYPPDTLIPIVIYEIYHPINKSKLNLSYCQDINIELDIPAIIDENNLFKYDPNSGFYTDNCYSYTTEQGTDIILSDRRQEYNDNNLSLCQKNCEFNGYNKDNKYSICLCEIKIKMELISDIKDDSNKLSDYPYINKNSQSSNIITIKCINSLFTINGLKYNISNYIFLIFVFYYLLSIILFIKCGYYLLENDINEIINLKKKINKKKHNSKKKNNFPPKRKNKSISLIKSINIIKGNNNSQSKFVKKSKKNSINSVQENKKTKKNSMPNLNINTLKTNSKNRKKKKIKFNDFEINTLKYTDAISYDKRTFCEYYKSLLKTKHPLIFSFCPIKDYNILIIKLCIFCLSFSLYYSVNFFFFDDNMLHKIYKEGGKYNIINYLPKILIAFGSSHVLTIIIKFIFLSERNILQVRKQSTLSKAIEISSLVKRRLVIKYIIFYLVGILILGFFWILLSSFGAVFQNTQIIIFENTLISFGISFIYPFFINIFPCILRLFSLKSKSKYLYNFSKIIQII